jgi:hypothetical protein
MWTEPAEGHIERLSDSYSKPGFCVNLANQYSFQGPSAAEDTARQVPEVRQDVEVLAAQEQEEPPVADQSTLHPGPHPERVSHASLRRIGLINRWPAGPEFARTPGVNLRPASPVGSGGGLPPVSDRPFARLVFLPVVPVPNRQVKVELPVKGGQFALVLKLLLGRVPEHVATDEGSIVLLSPQM